MSCILVVDDRPINRQFLAELLGFAGHKVIEASDGEEALEVTLAERPDLIICDILMPRVDGYEFVRRLRGMPEIAASNIIFYTATYRSDEARALADATGIEHIITKPAAPEDILRIVAAALRRAGVPATALHDERYREEHIRVLTDSLVRKAGELESANARLAALVELELELASERDIDRILAKFARAARTLIPASWTAVALFDTASEGIAWFHTDGLEEIGLLAGIVEPRRGILGSMLARKRPSRAAGLDGDGTALGFSPAHPPLDSFLGVPIVAGAEAIGWFYLADRKDAAEFSDDDEKIATTLGTMLAVTFINLRLAADARAHAVRLEKEVAERRRVERELRDSEMRTRLATEAANIGIWEWNVRTGQVRWDDVMFQIYGMTPTPDGLITYGDWSATVLPEDLAEQEALLLDTVSRGGQSERLFRIRRRSDGATRTIHAREVVRPGLDGVVEWVVGTNLDVTERNEAEQRLADLARQNRMVLEAAAEGIYGLDREGRTTFVNPSAARMLGYAPEELLGAGQHALTHHSRPDGTPYPREECPIHAAARDGQTHHVDDEVFWRRDGSSFPVEYTSVPMRDEQGNVIGAVVSFNDISERRAAELRALRSQRSEAIGALAGGVAHDLNNALQPVLMGVELLRRRRDGAEWNAKHLDMIENSARRGAAMVHQLLAFARGTDGRRSVVPPRRVLGELETMIRSTFPRNITLQCSFQESLPELHVDPTQFYQTVLNLCVNARDAMPEGGTLRLEASVLDCDAPRPALAGEIAPGRYVEISVRDTGLGIPPEHMARLCEPFFSTKDLGRGTGFGLSTVASILASHRAALVVESEPGRGSRFSVCFPVPALEGEAPSERTPLPPFLGNGETVLVVDDEATIRSALGSLLETLNLKPLLAGDAQEALVRCREAGSALVLVLTDFEMPAMGGLALVDALRRAARGAHIAAITGAPDVAVESLRKDGVEHVLRKPFEVEEVVDLLRTVLPCDG